MPPIRWGLTEGAYRKWAFLFDKDLPTEIHVPKGALSHAGYIRDVIRYANENNLKGQDWFGAVQITATSDRTITIIPKGKISIANLPSLSAMELLNYYNQGKIVNRFKCYFPDGEEELAHIATSLNLQYVSKGNNIFEFYETEGV